MEDLRRFIAQWGHYLLWAAYVALSCTMLFTANPFQHHAWLTSAGALEAGIYRGASSVTGYFSLRDINDDLQRRNSDLELEITRLRQALRNHQEREYGERIRPDTVLSRYDFTIAHVINNTVARTANYATLQRGSLDGIEPEMGVIDQNGAVGIVNLVTPHTCRVITLLNPNLRLSCKIRGREQVGSLTWDGRNPGEAVLEEMPRHAGFRKGETVITSGYSSAFPEGVKVGTVIGRVSRPEDNFMTLRVKLSTDFTTLSTVRVVRDRLKPELDSLDLHSQL